MIISRRGVSVALELLGHRQEMNAVSHEFSRARRTRIVERDRLTIDRISIGGAPRDKDVGKSVENISLIRIALPRSDDE